MLLLFNSSFALSYQLSCKSPFSGKTSSITFFSVIISIMKTLVRVYKRIEEGHLDLSWKFIHFCTVTRPQIVKHKTEGGRGSGFLKNVQQKCICIWYRRAYLRAQQRKAKIGFSITSLHNNLLHLITTAQWIQYCGTNHMRAYNKFREPKCVLSV